MDRDVIQISLKALREMQERLKYAGALIERATLAYLDLLVA